ncbi:MAG: hypothetical protein H7301_12170 [Cryobacterium sp.]|nr:hypothetical protein [Oligoflexia bacterium]
MSTCLPTVGYLFGVFALSGCVQSSSLILRLSDSTAFSQTAGCPLPHSSSVANIRRRLASDALVPSPNFCELSANYECYSRVFSPIVQNSKTRKSECVDLEFFGQKVCLDVAVQNFDTREASRLSDSASGAFESGGEFNRAEFVCHQTELRDQDAFLAKGEGDKMSEALTKAHDECLAILPRLK